MKLWLARHAQPLVAPGICYGRLDVAADADATAECARQLAAHLPKGIRVVSSPLQRCEQLAQALQGLRPDLAYTTDPRLQEMDLGLWEGRAWQAIAQAELQAWTRHFADYAAGGSGESVTAFMARVASVFDELQGSDDTLWVTHAGVIRAVELLAQGLRQIERADQWPVDAPDYGQWRTLDLPIGSIGSIGSIG
ncbi:MAG: histidine phosphatase family protein [Polaromonas sp.]